MPIDRVCRSSLCVPTHTKVEFRFTLGVFSKILQSISRCLLFKTVQIIQLSSGARFNTFFRVVCVLFHHYKRLVYTAVARILYTNTHKRTDCKNMILLLNSLWMCIPCTRYYTVHRIGNNIQGDYHFIIIRPRRFLTAHGGIDETI